MPDYDPETCLTCNNSRAWHEQFKPMHPFNNGQGGATAFLGPRKGERNQDGSKTSQQPSQSGAWPLDPVLRVALINKGVLTPEDLRAAEEQIKVTTSAFLDQVKESRDGESTEKARWREV